MPYVETPVQTLNKFDNNQGWRESPKDVLTADFISANGESNLLWTPFFYEERGGKLFDPIRKKFVEGSANNDRVEEEVIAQLQDWFLSHDSGIGVWISPRGNGIRPYPEEQITIYRIGYKNIDSDQPLQKVLLFSWHQFKHKFKNPEDIRRYIFTQDDSDESVIEIINWLKKVSEKPVSNNFGDMDKRLQSAANYANQYKSGVPMVKIAYQMDQTKFLGKNPIGCSTASTTTLIYNSNTTEAFNYHSNETDWHGGTCRVCGNSTWVGPCSICKPCESKF